jgi:hypothetical protein
MKKLFLSIGIIALSSANSFIFAQEKVNKKEKSDKPVISTPAAKSVEDLALAQKSAEYGRKTNSVEALITAIKIVANTPTTKLEVTKTSNNIDSTKVDQGKKTSSANLSDITLSSLISDAKKMANGDKNLLALIEKASKADNSRGVVGGPKFTNERVLGRSQDNYIVTFEGLENAVVYVKGDGTTDLDLIVYDENGNLVESDADYTDECLVKFLPKWTGKFRIIVRNNGNVYNDYTLKTN